MNRIIQSVCVLILLGCVSTANAQTSTSEQFSELGKLLVGRWASKITLIADWPEFTKKQGEIVNGYTTCEWKADKYAFAEEELIAEGSNLVLYYFDLNTKTIKSLSVTSAGSTLTIIHWKDGDNWRWKCDSGMGSDGKKVTGTGTTRFEDNGATQIRDGIVYLDGKELPHYHDVYKRVNKN